MLNSCGHALSQKDGSDFHPRCNWEATPPGSSACVKVCCLRSWRRERTTWLWWRRGERTTRFGGRREGREDHKALVEWGPHGGNTADGARSLNHGLLLLFLRYGTPGQGRGRGKECASVGILKDFSILLKTFSHYSKSV